MVGGRGVVLGRPIVCLTSLPLIPLRKEGRDDEDKIMVMKQLGGRRKVV